MEQVQWDNSLSIGVDLIDEQHKALIQRLNDVYKAVEVQQGPMEITKTLGFLEEYTDYHFSAEEKHMQDNDYPGLEVQQQEHQNSKIFSSSLLRSLRRKVPRLTCPKT